MAQYERSFAAFREPVEALLGRSKALLQRFQVRTLPLHSTSMSLLVMTDQAALLFSLFCAAGIPLDCDRPSTPLRTVTHPAALLFLIYFALQQWYVEAGQAALLFQLHATLPVKSFACPQGAAGAQNPPCGCGGRRRGRVNHGRPTGTVAQAYFTLCLTVHARTQGAAGAVAPAAVGALEDPDDAAEWFSELLDDVLLRVDLAVDAARAALRVRAGPPVQAPPCWHFRVGTPV